jgi:polar amino acid transport system substrate-binding protein
LADSVAAQQPEAIAAILNVDTLMLGEYLDRLQQTAHAEVLQMPPPYQQGTFNLLLGCLIPLFVGRTAQAESLFLVADEWCPYNCAQDDKRQGYVVDLLAAIFAQVGVTTEYRVVPWSRAVKMVEQGTAQALLGTTSKNTPQLLLSQAIGANTNCFFAATEATWATRAPNIDEIKQLRLGVIQDYSNYDGGGPLDQYIASHPQNGRINPSSGANALQNNFQKILAGRVDLVVENCNVGNYSLQRYGLSQRIKSIGELDYFHGDLNIGFNPQDPRANVWVELVNQGIAEKRRNGELAKILHTYGLSDWASTP